MTVGTAYFYALGTISYSNRIYPLSPGSQYFHTEQVKYSADVQQRITVPAFPGYETVNLVRLGDLYYWCVGFVQSASVNSAIQFSLELCTVPSFLTSGMTVSGLFSRTPSRQMDRVLKEQISASQLMQTSKVALGKIRYQRMTTTFEITEYRTFWCDIYVTGGRHYGTFIDIVVDSQPVGVGGTTSPIGEVSGASAYVSNDPDRGVRSFVTPEEIIAHLSISANQIIGIYISERCPFAVEYLDSWSPSSTPILTYYNPVRLQGATFTYMTSTNTRAYYDFEGNNPTVAGFNTLNISVDELTGLCGHVYITSNSGQNISELLVTPDDIDTGNLSVSYRTITDQSGIRTYISCNDEYAIIQEGQIPYESDSWIDYINYNKQYDQANFQTQYMSLMENLKTDNYKAYRDFNISNRKNFADAMLSASLLTPLSGVSNVITQFTNRYDYETDWNVRNRQNDTQLNVLQAELAAKEAYAKAQPITVYNTGYGWSYAWSSYLTGGLSIRSMLPMNVTSIDLRNYTARYGYASEGPRTLSIRTGYWQGAVLPSASLPTGYYFDELNKTLSTGVTIV